jgi:Lsr2
MMARVETVRLVDDLDGGDANETVTFGLDGKTYEIDLSAENAAGLRDALKPYLVAGRRVLAGTPNSRPGRGLSDPAENAAIREWWKAQGGQIGDRGRISEQIRQAWRNRRQAA